VHDGGQYHSAPWGIWDFCRDSAVIQGRCGSWSIASVRCVIVPARVEEWLNVCDGTSWRKCENISPMWRPAHARACARQRHRALQCGPGVRGGGARAGRLACDVHARSTVWMGDREAHSAAGVTAVTAGEPGVSLNYDIGDSARGHPARDRVRSGPGKPLRPSGLGVWDPGPSDGPVFEQGRPGAGRVIGADNR
jgi:hypothetical protein